MGKRTQDRRINKTKAAIYRALLELLETREYSKITVTELTELADINRKTFYNHYSDISDVINEIEDLWVEHLMVNLQNVLSPYVNCQEADPEHIRRHALEISRPFFETTISELKDTPAYFRLINMADGHNNLMHKVVSEGKEMLLNTFGSGIKNNLWLDYLLIFSINGAMAMIMEWYKSGFDVSVEDLSKFFEILFTSDMAFDYINSMS